MKKIIFNDRYGLTQAVIEGRKTMTRRIVPTKTRLRRALAVIHDEPHGSEQEEYLKSAYYKVGEIVAVAQNYSSFYNILDNTRPIPEGAGWDNKMFVRADLMPHQIRITGIRCEKLQDISDADCLKEGIFVNEYFGNGKKCHHYGFDGFFNETEGWFARVWFNTPREAFASLIDKVSGRGTWASNPWVVAYEFELVK
jgi:hypothetical protein